MSVSASTSRRFLMLTSMTLLLACGDDPAPKPELAIDELRSALATQRCQRLVGCGFYPSQQSCVDAEAPMYPIAGYNTKYQVDQVTQGVADGSIMYDPIKAAECVASLTYMSCDITAKPLLGTEACDQMFQGTLDLGGDCYADQECGSAMECVGFAQRCPPTGPCECRFGQCQAIVLPPLGAMCRNVACAEGLLCGNTERCVDASGDSCTTVDDCPFGTYCSVEGDACKPLPVLGQVCVGTELCLDERNICVRKDSMTRTCQRRRDIGEDCIDHAYGHCLYGSFCDNGQCLPKGEVGDECPTPPFGPECLGGLSCVDTTRICTQPRTTAPCSRI